MVWEVSVDRYVEGGYVFGGKVRLFLFGNYDAAASFAEYVRGIARAEEEDLSDVDRRRLKWIDDKVATENGGIFPEMVNVDAVEPLGSAEEAFTQIGQTGSSVIQKED